jgi:hypothetical protein
LKLLLAIFLAFARHGLPMAVVKHGRLDGLLSRPDVPNWIQLRRNSPV